MKQCIVLFVALACSLLLLAGCTNMTPRQQGTLSGAAIGAVGGAAFSALTGGNAAIGAGLGGAIGGVTGYIIGNEKQKHYH